MEACAVTLTDDEVRARFSAYREGELPEAEAAQVRARLDESTALAAEYARFERLLGAMAALSVEGERVEGLPRAGSAGAPADAAGASRRVEPASVDLLPAIQQRLHQRSGGRFFRDRWSRLAGLVPIELAAAAVLALLVVAYLAMNYVTVSAP